MVDPQNDLEEDSDVPAQPVIDVAWRGNFKILDRNIDMALAARVSNKACFKVWEAARKMPKSICLELLPRLDIWPKCFKNSPPSDDHIALFFFPEERGEQVLGNLLKDAICNDFALRSAIDSVELLIFTSLQLPENHHRFQGSYYLWGVFRAKHRSADRNSTRNNDNHQDPPRLPGRLHLQSTPDTIDASVLGNEKNSNRSSELKKQNIRGSHQPEFFELQVSNDTPRAISTRYNEGTPSIPPISPIAQSVCREGKIIQEAKEVSQPLSPQGHQEGDGSTAFQCGSETIHSSFLMMANAFDEDIDAVESSPIQGSFKNVGPYLVDSNLAPLLQDIFDKYGDISRDCIMQSNSMRSKFLQNLCKTCLKLQNVKVTELDGRLLQHFDDALTEAEMMKLDVHWLRERYHKLHDTLRGIQCYPSLKDALARSMERAESSKVSLASKNAQLKTLQNEIQSMESQLASLPLEIENQDCALEDMLSKFKTVHLKSLVDGLL